MTGICRSEEREYPLRRPMREGARRRLDIYTFIVEYADGKDGPTPSIREISLALSLSYASTYYHVMKLIAHGLLQQVDNKLLVTGSEWIPPHR